MLERKETTEAQVELKSVAGEDQPELPAMVPNPSTAPKSLKHSLFHQMGKANCDAKWDGMVGGDNTRQCRACKTHVYKVDGLDEVGLADLIAKTEPKFDLNTQPLFRRPDGTVMTAKGFCQTQQNFFLALACISTVASILIPQITKWDIFGQLPFFNMFTVFACLNFAMFVRMIDKKDGIRRLAFLGSMLLTSGVLVVQLLTIPGLVTMHFSYVYATVGIIALLGAVVCFAIDVVMAAKRSRDRKSQSASSMPSPATNEGTTSGGIQPPRKLAIGIVGAVLALVCYAIWDVSGYAVLAEALDIPAGVRPGDDFPRVSRQLFQVLPQLSGDRAAYARVQLARSASDGGAHDRASELLNQAFQDLDGKNINNQVLHSARKVHVLNLLRQKRYLDAEVECKKTIAELERADSSQGGLRIVFGIYNSLDPGRNFATDMKRDIMSRLPTIQQRLGKDADAEETLKLLLKPFPGQPFDPASIYKIGVRPYVEFLQLRGRQADAVKVVEMYEKECNRQCRGAELATAQNNIRYHYTELNDKRAERDLYQAMEESYGTKTGPRVQAVIKYARLLAANGETAKADRYFQTAVELARASAQEQNATAKVPTPNSQLQRACEAYGDVLTHQARFAEAEKFYQEALNDAAIDPRTSNWQHVGSWRVHTKLAKVLIALKRPQEALKQMSEAAPILEELGMSVRERYYLMNQYTKALKSAGEPDADRFAVEMEKLKWSDHNADKETLDYLLY